MAIKREDYDFDEDELSNVTLTMTFEDEDVEEVVENKEMTFERLKDFHMNAIQNIAGGVNSDLSFSHLLAIYDADNSRSDAIRNV